MNLDFRQLIGFLAWLERAAQADRLGLPFPEAPTLEDPTLRRWVERLLVLERAVRAEDGRAHDVEASIDGLATQLGDLALFAAEHLAVAYEVAGRPEQAQALRMRAAALTIRRASV